MALNATQRPEPASRAKHLPPPCVPSYLGAYRVESLLGHGGMGEVYLAWDERLRRRVAIKRLRDDRAFDRLHRARFRREARAVARLNHPSIVQVYDVLEAENDAIVMELVEGESLSDLLNRRALDLREAVGLAIEIARGLVEAHAKGLLHRDLKAGNIMVTPAGHAKILDFGLACALSNGTGDDTTLEPLTASGTLVGTCHALSPEQIRDQPVDHRSDLFSFGSLLYEMLTGRAPFRAVGLVETLGLVVGGEPEPLEDRLPNAPPKLVHLVHRLLAKEPKKRPQTAREVVDELKRVMAGWSAAPALRTAREARWKTRWARSESRPPSEAPTWDATAKMTGRQPGPAGGSRRLALQLTFLALLAGLLLFLNPGSPAL